jgi:F-type H+-transporting ATPase subunit a
MKKRYIIYLCVLGLIAVTVWLTPVLPVIQLPGEILVGGIPVLGGLTNTFVATILTFIILVALTLSLRAGSRTADEIPTGFYNFFEMIIEGAYGYVQGAAGHNAKKFFPFFMTFILWIVTANWMELIPGVDAIGIAEDLAHHEVEVAEEAAHAAGEVLTEEEIHAIEEEASHEGGKFLGSGFIQLLVKPEEGEEAGHNIIPFIRAAATDLNFTLALALISVSMTWYYGMQALGLGFWKKFFVWDGDKIARNPLAILDPIVGLLELIGELARILSFSFRLLGNIFAGQVLLFVIASLVPVANLIFWHLEFAVGILQAVIFALLTLTFMSGAVQSHHGEEEHH